jgi:hypothetical protein
MTAFLPNPEARPTPESLPEWFDAADQRIDHLLNANARQMIEPVGLRRRIFEASIAALPVERQPALHLVGTDSEGSVHGLAARRRLTWSRMAMAASVALAFGIGTLMFMSSPKPTATMEIAAVDRAHSPAAHVLSSTEAAAIAMSDLNKLPAGSIDRLDGQMNYLLNTRDVASLDDVRGELLTLVAALEM